MIVAITAQEISDWSIYTGLLASIASLVLAIVAIWMALHFKRESDSLNKETTNLLIEIRSDAKTVAQVALPELRAYGDSMRKLVFEKHYPGEVASSAKPDGGLVSALGHIEEEIAGLRKATDITEVKRKLDEVSRELDRSKKTAKEVAEAPTNRDVMINLPEGGALGFSDLNITWGTLIDVLKRDLVKKSDFSVDTLGKKYVFVNETTGTQIDLPGDALQKLPVAATGVGLGDRLRLKEK